MKRGIVWFVWLNQIDPTDQINADSFRLAILLEEGRYADKEEAEEGQDRYEESV